MTAILNLFEVIKMNDFTFEKGNIKTALETYEWDNVWIEHASDTEHERVLYVGDSISCGTRRIATERSGEKIYFDGFGTSKALDNPYFIPALDLFVSQLPKSPEVIIFNNGLHGWHLDDTTDYGVYYDKFLRHLTEKYKKSRIYVLLTTAIIDEVKNPRVKARNKVATELAGKYSLPVIDLYSLVNENTELIWEDGVHPTTELYGMIADKIIGEIKK